MTMRINIDILKRCREQMGLSLEHVRKKVPLIKKIEDNKKQPTFKQLDILAELYEVPRWVFIAETLPDEYKYSQKTSFRKFRDARIDEDSQIPRLIARVEKYRELVLELREDMDMSVPDFKAPNIDSLSEKDAAQKTRQWLNLADETPDFHEYRKKLEEKHIFIFLTSKYKGWSHTEEEWLYVDAEDWSHIDKDIFRGLCIYNKQLPIIIINDSDSRKAQLFTLLHELGHLLREETYVDQWTQKFLTEEEKWCDLFAGNVLIPPHLIQDDVFNDLNDIKDRARSLNVSDYAFLVRLKQLNEIDQNQYEEFETILKKEYKKYKENLKKNPLPINRNRASEVKKQFGMPFTRTLLTAFYNEELSFHKSMQLLDLKRPSQFIKLMEDI